MAEPIGLASGLISLASFTLDSSIALFETIRSFKYRPMQVRNLMEELESLREVLRTFTETAEIIHDEDRSALDIPLHRCGDYCRELEQEILKRFSQSGDSHANFRGWAKLKYMGDDIDGFRRRLSAYKLTFIIALAGTTLRQTKVTAEVVENYKELIQLAEGDLEAIMKDMEERINALSGDAVTNSNEDVLELQRIREEELSAQNGLQVCAQFSEYIKQPGLRCLPTNTHLDSGYGSLSGTLIETTAGEEDDARSVRSILTNKSRVNLAPDDEKLIISAFVGDLCQSFRLHGDPPIRDRIATSLPDLLRTFSLRLEESASSKAEWDAKEFIRQQRARITKQFIQVQTPTQMSDEVDQRLPTDDGMSLTEKMALWNLEEPADFLLEPAIDDPSPHEVPITPHYQEVREFLLGGSAYQWILENVRAAASLTERKGTMVGAISKKMNDVLSSIKITTALHSQRFQVDFDMSWDLPAFLQDQEYPERIEVALEQAITLTASGVDAQAMSCADYMRQTWPSSGRAVVQALQKTLTSPNMWCSSVLPDGTTMDVGFRPGRTSIKARGSQAGLTELGEQLAWLAAALHPTPEPLGVYHATPEIITFKPIHCFSVPSILVRIKPSFKKFLDQRTATGDAGTCWHGLFRNPVVVDGFPIRARPRDQRGLELSLEMMSVLAEAPHATPYDNTLILKGPCTMLVPTARAAESVTWHFLYNADGRRMPCYEFRQRCPNWINMDQVNIDLLERRGVRHFVGWASTITRHLGTPDVKYNQISWAGSKRCTPGFAVEQRLTISVSKFVGGGASILRGGRDKPEYVQHSDYTAQIDQARRTPIVLYDVADQRGWLVDGASTLLHLARTQVERGPYGGSGSLFNNPSINREFFHHPDINNGPDGCAKVLKEECNMKHIIFREFDSYADETKAEERNEIHKTMCMRELVSQTWSTLQQIYDRQVEEATTHITKQLRSPVGKKLEGYEFMDIVLGNHILTRRHVGLGSNGATWTGFTNQIYAVTLFGSHFGDLYQPDKNIERTLCPKWRTVPMGQQYLAAPVSLLWEIKYRSWCDGEVDADSPEIARRISWYPSQYAFRGCKPGCTHFWDRVQNLQSPADSVIGRISIGGARPTDNKAFSQIHGAVILGRTSTLDPNISAVDIEGRFHDSGLGSSLQELSASSNERDCYSSAPSKLTASPKVLSVEENSGPGWRWPFAVNLRAYITRKLLRQKR